LYLGYPDRALALSEAAVTLGKRVEHPLSLADALFWGGVVHVERGEFDRTRDRNGEVLRLAEQLGSPQYLGWGMFLRGWARVESGEDAPGFAEMQEAMDELARIESGIRAPLFFSLLAESLRKVGRHDEAVGALGLGVAQAEQQGQHFYDAELHRLRAEIIAERGLRNADSPSPNPQSEIRVPQSEAETLFGHALEIARRQEAKTFELRAATSLARLWQRQGKREDARALLAPLYAWFTEGFDTRDLQDARILLDELS
jgi:predicted ATPase